MRKITETKVVEISFVLTEEEAKFIYKLLGQMSDIDVASTLGIPTREYTKGSSDTFHYQMWKQLNEEFFDEEK